MIWETNFSKLKQCNCPTTNFFFSGHFQETCNKSDIDQERYTHEFLLPPGRIYPISK